MEKTCRTNPLLTGLMRSYTCWFRSGSFAECSGNAWLTAKQSSITARDAIRAQTLPGHERLYSVVVSSKKRVTCEVQAAARRKPRVYRVKQNNHKVAKNHDSLLRALQTGAVGCQAKYCDLTFLNTIIKLWNVKFMIYLYSHQLKLIYDLCCYCFFSCCIRVIS